MFRVLALAALAACADGSRKPPPPTGGSGGVGAKRHEPNCSTSFASKPDRDGAPMCLVPAGEITMTMPADPVRGADAATWRVKVSKQFHVDQHEVTNAQYVAFLRAGGHACGKEERYCFAGSDKRGYDLKSLTVEPSFERLPAEVTLAGAEAYCAWAGKRLPTDAEWELAARLDPATGSARVYPWGDTYRPGVANHFGTIEPRRGKLAAVGSFPDDRSAIGAYDMGGNAAEWVADCYVRAPQCGPTCVDPLIVSNCEQVCEEGAGHECSRAQVIRAADILTKPSSLTTRRKTFPDSSYGVRCVR